jgi:hypothetical protein
MELTSQHTRTDQMVGTVAYMAPERFDSRSREITSAADIFAWGAVVTYAGTGRTPFAADSPPATAARILTQPPDLSGLSGPLRDLVALALVKDPAERPTARELLDLLLNAGPQGAPAFAAGLDERPVLRRAAEAARETGRHSTGDQARPVPPTVGAGSAGVGSVATSPVGTGRVGTGPARRRRWLVPAVAAVVVLALCAGALVGFAPAVMALLDGEPEVTVDVTVGRGAPRSAGSSPGPSAPAPEPVPSGGEVIVADPLTGPQNWSLRTDDGEASSCTFDNALVVVRRTAGSYRCPGPRADLTGDQRINVDVSVDSPDTCAAVWLLFSGTSGYQVRICPGYVEVGTHKGTEESTLGRLPVTAAFQPGVRHRVGIGVGRRIARLTVDGTAIGQVPLSDAAIVEGRVVLGIRTDAVDGGDHRVTFANVQIVAFED